MYGLNWVGLYACRYSHALRVSRGQPPPSKPTNALSGQPKYGFAASYDRGNGSTFRTADDLSICLPPNCLSGPSKAGSECGGQYDVPVFETI